MNAGDWIYEFSATNDVTEAAIICKKNLILGHVTAGSFSPSRGCVHGIGIISAKHFLTVVSRCSLASTVLSSVSTGQDSILSNKRIELRVLIKNAKSSNKNQLLREASLFILL